MSYSCAVERLRIHGVCNEVNRGSLDRPRLTATHELQSRSGHKHPSDDPNCAELIVIAQRELDPFINAVTSLFWPDQAWTGLSFSAKSIPSRLEKSHHAL